MTPKDIRTTTSNAASAIAGTVEIGRNEGMDREPALGFRELAIFGRSQEIMAALQRSHPTYFAYMDDANPMLARRSEILDLMEKAPNDAIFMYLVANFNLRLELAAVTGREFE